MCVFVSINIHVSMYVKYCNQMSLYMRPVLSQDVDNLSDLNASPYSGKFLKADLMQYNL